MRFARRQGDPKGAGDVPVYLVHLGQDDPKRNTALRLARRNLAGLVEHSPRGGILLDPEVRRSVSREDAPLMADRGLVAVDCSWEQVADATKGHRRSMERRALPFLVAANPVKFGKPFMLSTAEAVAAALFVAGFEPQARKVMDAFPWGPRFFEVNAEPLADYAACATSAEVVEAQKAFV